MSTLSENETYKTTNMEVDEESSEKMGTQNISGNSVLPSLALVPILLLMMQHLKLESDTNKNEINRLKMENDALNEELVKSKYEISRMRNCLNFPLLFLPDEIIGNIFSFLPIKDRMIARICKRLDDIESAYKYYVPRLLIHEIETNDHRRFNNSFITDHKQYFVLLKERIYSIDFFKKIISNAKFGYLAITIPPTNELYREMYSLIKYCDVGELNLPVGYSAIEEVVVVDSFLFDLTGICSKLKLYTPAGITAEGLHKVYSVIMDQSSKLRSLNIREIMDLDFNRKFLRLIGIGFAKGDLYSKRNIEAFEYTDVLESDDDDYDDIEYVYKHVFDGQLEMTFTDDKTMPFNEYEGMMKLKWHETEEDLANAKKTKGFVKVEVFPE